jgi:arylsulfatase A-like enzyme
MATHPTLLGSVVAIACTSIAHAQFVPPASSLRGNVLLVVADDLGIDGVGCYGAHPDAPPTPNLDALAAEGILFRSAYTDPTCSPSRAAMLTGRYGYRTFLGQPINENLPEYSLQQPEITLAEAVHNVSAPIAVSAVGKWHLGSASNGGPLHPNQQGFDWFGGTLGNMFWPTQSYYSHYKVINGVQTNSTVYATTEQVDDAIARIQAMPEPWFLYVAFNAPHQPFHAPPSNLHDYHLFGNPDDTPDVHFHAAIQAMDRELGRLLASLAPAKRDRTTIFFVGDNGSPNEATTPPFEAGKAKGTLYEGGVHVPLIVAGRGVRSPGRESTALINSVDLFPTVLDLLGIDEQAAIVDGRPIDGVSMLPYMLDATQASLRTWVFAERFTPNGLGPYQAVGRMVRDERWKLIQRAGQVDLFYDMENLLLERESLLPGTLSPEQFDAYRRLKSVLIALARS